MPVARPGPRLPTVIVYAERVANLHRLGIRHQRDRDIRAREVVVVICRGVVRRGSRPAVSALIVTVSVSAPPPLGAITVMTISPRFDRERRRGAGDDLAARRARPAPGPVALTNVEPGARRRSRCRRRRWSRPPAPLGDADRVGERAVRVDRIGRGRRGDADLPRSHRPRSASVALFAASTGSAVTAEMVAVSVIEPLVAARTR